MRKSILLTAVFLFMGMALSAQKGSLLESIGKNDLSGLKSAMKEQIEFCINDGQQNVKKTKALELISAFLSDVNPKSCRKVHLGDSKQKGSYYEVGKLKTAKGNYRVFIYYENNKVVEFRIDNY